MSTWIRSPSINASWRGGKISQQVIPEFGLRRLCETADRYLRQEGFVEIVLWVLAENEPAINFYQSIGYVRDVGLEKLIERGGKLLAEVRFRKPLT